MIEHSIKLQKKSSFIETHRSLNSEGQQTT